MRNASQCQTFATDLAAPPVYRQIGAHSSPIIWIDESERMSYSIVWQRLQSCEIDFPCFVLWFSS
jgi:hypothetical protein